MVWLGTLWVASASGGVVVDDAASCVDDELVALEARSWAGDDAINRSELRVTLVADEENALRLSLQARTLDDRPDAILWSYATQVQRVDCGLLPTMIGRIAEQQYAGIPVWHLKDADDRVVEGLVELIGTAPDAWHFGFGGGVAVPVARRHWRVFAISEGYLASPIELGFGRESDGSPSPRTGQFAGVMAGIGVGADLPAGSFAGRIRGQLAGGPHVAFGRDFDGNGNDQQWRPRVVAAAQLDLLTPSAFRMGLRVAVPVVRLALRQDLDPTTVAPEPWVRVGVVVGFGGPLRARRVDSE